MRVEQLDKESKIIGFQDYINNNCNAIFLNGGLIRLRKKDYLIFCVIIFINRNKNFYQILKRLKKIKGVIC